jgi:hypothetical protein
MLKSHPLMCRLLIPTNLCNLLKLSGHSDTRKVKVISLRALDCLSLKIGWVHKVSNQAFLKIVKETLQGVIAGMLKLDSAS